MSDGMSDSMADGCEEAAAPLHGDIHASPMSHTSLLLCYGSWPEQCDINSHPQTLSFSTACKVVQTLDLMQHMRSTASSNADCCYEAACQVLLL